MQLEQAFNGELPKYLINREVKDKYQQRWGKAQIKIMKTVGLFHKSTIGQVTGTVNAPCPVKQGKDYQDYVVDRGYQ